MTKQTSYSSLVGKSRGLCAVRGMPALVPPWSGAGSAPRRHGCPDLPGAEPGTL